MSETFQNNLLEAIKEFEARFGVKPEVIRAHKDTLPTLLEDIEIVASEFPDYVLVPCPENELQRGEKYVGIYSGAEPQEIKVK